MKAVLFFLGMGVLVFLVIFGVNRWFDSGHYVRFTVYAYNTQEPDQGAVATQDGHLYRVVDASWLYLKPGVTVRCWAFDHYINSPQPIEDCRMTAA